MKSLQIIGLGLALSLTLAACTGGATVPSSAQATEPATVEPATEPTLVPVEEPTAAPVEEPTAVPAAAPTAEPAAEPAALTVEQLRNAGYSGIYTYTVTLTDGVYAGEPFAADSPLAPHVEYVEHSAVFGDLVGDGSDDAAVLLVENSGGSGVFTYVSAQLNQGGAPVDGGAVLLGDRTQVSSMHLADGRLVVEIVTQGPDEPMCCGTLKVRKTLALKGGVLAEIGSEDLGNVSLGDLTGTSWTLIQVDQDQPVAPGTEITLNFADGSLNGKSGCNQYSGGVTSDGGQNLQAGQLVTTLMACPEPAMSQETAYLAALGGARQWSYSAGNLAILYQDENGDYRTLLFAPAASDATATAGATIPAPPDVINATFVCPDGTNIPVVFNNVADEAEVTLPDGVVTLPRAISGSGARYSDGTTTLWNKGNEVLVEVNGATIYEHCVAQ